MKIRALLACLALIAVSVPVAEADVWKWIDADGVTHFVDTNRPIYTWVDNRGEVHYADLPGHRNAKTVKLIWHSPGSLSDMENPRPEGSAGPTDGSEEPEKDARYYCDQATEVYELYIKAPRLFRDAEDGSREYLSNDEATTLIAETLERKNELCAGL